MPLIIGTFLCYYPLLVVHLIRQNICLRHSPDHRHDQYNEYKQGDTATPSLIADHWLVSIILLARSHGHIIIIIIIIIKLLTLVSQFHGSLVRAVSGGWR